MKRVVETIYSPGAITERVVHRIGTGSKRNCTHEKILINEVIVLFLGNPFDERNSSQELEHGFMVSLQGLIITKLDRKKLDRETMFIQHEDSAGILLNSVNHIYGRIQSNWEPECTRDKDRFADEVKNVIDEVMEYEPELLVPNIDDHIFAGDDSDDKDGGDDEE